MPLLNVFTHPRMGRGVLVENSLTIGDIIQIYGTFYIAENQSV